MAWSTNELFIVGTLLTAAIASFIILNKPRMKEIHIHFHQHADSETTQSLHLIINKLQKIMADLTTLETEVQENSSVIGSAITLLNGLKAQLDAAGTDAEKLKALSDQLDSQSNALASAVAANTPAAEPGA